MCGRALCQDLCWKRGEMLLRLQEHFFHKFWLTKSKGKLIKRLNLNSAKSCILSYENTNIQVSNDMHSGCSATWTLDLHFNLLHFCSFRTSIYGNGCIPWVLLFYLYTQSFLPCQQISDTYHEEKEILIEQEYRTVKLQKFKNYLNEDNSFWF